MRQLPQKLKERFDAYFLGREQTLSPTELLIETAASLIGITVKDQEVIDLIRSTICKPWGEAWCVDFTQTCIAYVEVTRRVLSPLPATEGVLDLWTKAKAYNASQPPQIGDLILWQMGTSQSGHTGIITKIDSLIYETIEGNTSDSSGIDRDGNGVFAKKRARGGTKTFSELGFLRCFP